MEKPDPAGHACPACQKTAKLSRDINTAVEFWECEGGHMFVVDKKPPKLSAAATAAAAAAASAAAAADAATEATPKTD